MCGIFALLNNHYLLYDFIKNQFNKGKNRGPEFSKLEDIFIKTLFGFHRLAINGLNEKSNQPFMIDNISLICNGEIYNYKELYELMGIVGETDSDCEVIIHLYKRYGIEQTLTMLDGVFAFVLCDYRNSSIDNPDLINKLYIARDPYGVRPLYMLSNCRSNYITDTIIGFASELKSLVDFQNFVEDGTGRTTSFYQIEQVKPGIYSEFEYSNKALSFWKPCQTNVPYHLPSFSFQSYYPKQIGKKVSMENVHHYCQHIQKKLIESVNKRCLTTERPIACLLSGGLDSSLITGLVNEFQRKHNPSVPLETYSIGLVGSVDLENARIVADYLKTKHTEIIVTEQEMCEAVPEVIQAIESYDTTTVRASIGNYLLGKYIAKHSKAKVIFNGDGSDELCGGYLYMNQCPDPIEFDRETRRLLKDIHLFDVLRSDKCISSHGLEPRTPFLDRSFVSYYLSIPPEYRSHICLKKCEKYLLRQSFRLCLFQNSEGNQILPDEILWRRKEAFSDGVSMQGRSLYQILQEYAAKSMNHLFPEKKFPDDLTTEKAYYLHFFERYYPHQRNILPYYWMPKYTNATDPSARTLTIY